MFEFVGEIFILLHKSIKSLLNFDFSKERTLFELERIGVGSVFFIVITSLFMGIISLFLTANQLKKLIPDFSLLGAGFIQLMTKELVPVLVGLMIAARVGSAISAEISSMVVKEETEAMILFGMDPISHIISPILLATMISIPILSIIGLFCVIAAGTVSAYLYFDIHPLTFLNFRYTHFHNFLFFTLKSLGFAILIPIISSLHGFFTGGMGAYSVGRSAVKGVVYSSFAVIICDLVLSLLEHALW